MVLCIRCVPLICIVHFVLLLFIPRPSSCQSQLNFRSIILKPSTANPANFGSGTLQTHIGEVTNINDEWNVLIRHQNTWQFILSLYKTWGFNSHLQSTVRITIDSPSIASGPAATFDDILFGFTTDNAEYFSMWIPFDNAGQKNRIYPSCDTQPHSFISGDVASLPYSFNAACLTTDCKRHCYVAGGSCDNWNTIFPKTAQSPDQFESISFPITFILENDPISNTLFVYFDSASFTQSFIQKCAFVALPTNRGLKLYIGGNEMGQSFVIESIQIEAWETQPTTAHPTPIPTQVPSNNPTSIPTQVPTNNPTQIPTQIPTNPTQIPTQIPTNNPLNIPTHLVSHGPTDNPTNMPSITPTDTSMNPSQIPSNIPTIFPTISPSIRPSFRPSNTPSTQPTMATHAPSLPSNPPSISPSVDPSTNPTMQPSFIPSNAPSLAPINAPSLTPSYVPSNAPSFAPSAAPINAPSFAPSNAPSFSPSVAPTVPPTPAPSNAPSFAPSAAPSMNPTVPPTKKPTINPTLVPTMNPTTNPITKTPSVNPSITPSTNPSFKPTIDPTVNPTTFAPTQQPITHAPTIEPTMDPTLEPTTIQPTTDPSWFPTSDPTNPTFDPTVRPTLDPTQKGPTLRPIFTFYPTTEVPTSHPTIHPITPTIGNALHSTDSIESTAPYTTDDDVSIKPKDNGRITARSIIESAKFGEIILPLTLIVLVGGCALCCVVIVIIRQLCMRFKRNRTPHKYINPVQNTPDKDMNRQRPLSLSDSMGAQHIHHVHHVHPRQYLTVPLKKNTFCRNLSDGRRDDNMLMEDIIDEMDDSFHRKMNPEARSFSNSHPLCVQTPIESTSSDSDDTMMGRPERHNYSTMTLKSGKAIVDELHNDIEMAQRAPKRRRDRGAKPYHRISQISGSGLDHLQSVINEAKTHSDFDRLDSLIKKGMVPNRNFPRGRKPYHYKAPMERKIKEEEEYFGTNRSSESTEPSSSESSEAVALAASVFVSKKKNASKLENKIVMLDGSELANKLVVIKNDRKAKKRRHAMKKMNRSPQYVD